MIGMDTLDNKTLRLAERLGTALQLPDTLSVAESLVGYHPADIAEVMERLSDTDTLRVFRALDPERAAEVLDELDSQKARYLLDNELPERIATLLDMLPMDDAAELLAESASPERQEVLLGQWTDQDDAAEVREILSYPKDSAGRLMTEKFARLAPDLTVKKAFAAIRLLDPEVETLNDLYITEGDKLVGVLSLRSLVRAQPKQILSDLMTRDVISVKVDTDQEEVAQLISKYDFLAVPVVDNHGDILGIVTVDDIVDVLREEQTEDAFKQGAISMEPGVMNAPYFSVPIWRVVKSRVGWLVLLFVAGTATSAINSHYQDAMKRVVDLAFFSSLLIGTGGNTGAQTISTIIRALSLRDIRPGDLYRVFLRELLAGLLLGFLMGCIAFVWMLLKQEPIALSLVISLTIFAVCVWANVIGSIIPVLASKLKIDPALVSAPLITTLVDTTGLLIYFTIAYALLEKLH
jgi:magnesium transporter